MGDVIAARWLIVLALVSGAPAMGQPFERRTEAAGLAGVAATNGVALADYDRDGDLDIYFVAHASYDPIEAATWNRLFANRGDGTFVRVSGNDVLAGRDSSTAESPMGYKMGASWGDFNNDGWPDLYLTHLGPNQLLRNTGGAFEDVTAAAGVAGGLTQLSSSSLWWDFDLDGDLDLYVATYEDYPAGTRDRRNLLYENLGDGRFAEIGAASGLDDAGATWTSVALDVNNDGRQDLYLANDFGPNTLFVNNGDKTFSEQTTAYGLEDAFHGMGLAIGDPDRNGFFDIYLTNITESGFDAEINPLFMNQGTGGFTRAEEAAGVSLAGWGWGTAFFDLENDGDEDLFVATGYFEPDYENVLFRNERETGTTVFEVVSASYALDDTRTARGLAVFDADDDGDQDLLISNFFDTPSLFINPIDAGSWLAIHLEGVASNRDGLGAVVTVRAGGETYRRYHHGAQFLGQNLQHVHVGLAAAEEVDSLWVLWPGGAVDAIGPLPARQTIRIREGSGVVEGVVTGREAVAEPALFRLLGGAPNPFSASVRIETEWDRPGRVRLHIFDALGREVHRQYVAVPGAGVHAVVWTPAASAASGVYTYILEPADSVGDRARGRAVGRVVYVK
ncbi:MAG: CRTAC1 family protein [Rhodothermales bacterium]|nr:CRTAC1 family protein [Rhodothermales bacterium]